MIGARRERASDRSRQGHDAVRSAEDHGHVVRVVRWRVVVRRGGSTACGGVQGCRAGSPGRRALGVVDVGAPVDSDIASRPGAAAGRTGSGRYPVRVIRKGDGQTRAQHDLSCMAQRGARTDEPDPVTNLGQDLDTLPSLIDAEGVVGDAKALSGDGSIEVRSLKLKKGPGEPCNKVRLNYRIVSTCNAKLA